MKSGCVLTVSQSKRLIARAVPLHPVVKTAYHNGNIGISRGTTCSYIASEFLGRKIEPFAYTTGVVTSNEHNESIHPPDIKIHDIIIRHGEIHMDGETISEASKSMNPGDVIIKGANALNYRAGVAGCLIGHPEGGTLGSYWGRLFGRKIRLVIPVGLEKEITSDILCVSEQSLSENPGVSLMPITGIIITEIEAIKLITGAEATQIGAGGIRGAEGSIRLLIEGTPDEIKSCEILLKELADEPPF